MARKTTHKKIEVRESIIVRVNLGYIPEIPMGLSSVITMVSIVKRTSEFVVFRIANYLIAEFWMFFGKTL